MPGGRGHGLRPGRRRELLARGDSCCGLWAAVAPVPGTRSAVLASTWPVTPSPGHGAEPDWELGNGEPATESAAGEAELNGHEAGLERERARGTGQAR